MTRRDIELALVLGLMSALGPLAIDMYLPALPTMAEGLGTTEGMMQQSLMAFFAGLAGGQLLLGPLSDRLGRRKTIVLGLSIYMLAALACLAATHVGQLIALRVLQGFGGAVGASVGFAVVRDRSSGIQAARLMSIMVMVLGIAPVLAPLAGSAIIMYLPWRAVFLVLALAALGCMVLVLSFLPETTTPEQRAASKLGAVFGNYLRLLGDIRFWPVVLTSALAMGGFFAYVSGSAFFFVVIHGVSPQQFSGLFAVNAVGMIASAQAVAPLMGKFGPLAVLKGGTLVFALACVAQLAMLAAGVDTLAPYCVTLFIAASAMSLLMPICGMMALAAWGHMAGTAAALMAALQFGTGALSSALVGLLANGTSGPMFVVMGIATIAAAVCAFGLVRPVSSSAHPAASSQGAASRS